jgi:hypothetical protein
MKSIKQLTILILLMFTFLIHSEELKEYKLIIRNHKFEPPVLKVKASEKFRLIVENQDSTFEEFESKKMIIEKFVNPKGKLNLIIGPFKAGEYDFFGEFHMSTAKGKLIAE